jgi:hypothetical protein
MVEQRSNSFKSDFNKSLDELVSEDTARKFNGD